MQQCYVCGRKYQDDRALWRCECGGVLEHSWDGEGPVFDREQITRGPGSIYRYRGALPLAPGTEPVTLGEGMTPLLAGEWNGLRVRYKLDYLCPTGSFKDRGASLVMTWLKAAGVRAILEDSSGNAGASMAAYAAAAGIQCQIFIPAYASAGKAAQIAAYGAELVRVPGTREDTTRAALQAAESRLYASHNWVPWFLEGTKTAAFELWEQLGWQVPDVVVCPAGYGSFLLGLYKGFRELVSAGVAPRMPRLVAVQAANCAPLVQALEQGLQDVPAVQKQETMAEGISCSKPVRGAAQLEALRATGGTAVAVSEEEIRQALWTLARKGLYVEPTSAAAAAALDKLRAAGAVADGEEVVLCLTGTGLKATDKIAAMMAEA
jgi:threonine synthase